ncbi:MAG: sigma-54-dependent Fis family transcriptional regulator [Acidobacteriota bacterium]
MNKVGLIKNLADNFARLLETEHRLGDLQIQELLESIKLIQGDTADRRFQQIINQLRALQNRLKALAEIGRDDYLKKLMQASDDLSLGLADRRIAKILETLFEPRAVSLNAFCAQLLDALIDATQAERGFLLFYVPESTEADIIAARNYSTMNLSVGEYHFSRTLLREIFQCQSSLLIDDASQDRHYSAEASIIRFGIKSVVAAPLKHLTRTVGAIYLENNSRPCAFDEQDLQVLESVTRLALFYLEQCRLLPEAFHRKSSVFLDASKASREIIGADPAMLTLLEIIERIADSRASVLIEGESGTGKELVARALHYQSNRREKAFIAINCAAIPDELLESELFGHEKGAFTGATERHIGHIEQSDGGTLFLDEVSELAYPLQAKLLRFLQSQEFRRLGGKEILNVDTRIIAATSKDLKAMMAERKFQEALYYRLNVVPVKLPALRERRGDIPMLADYFFDKFATIYAREISASREVYEMLAAYDWPGNVRELENLIHRLVLLSKEPAIYPGDLPKEILDVKPQRINLEGDPLYQCLHTLPATLEELRRRRKEVQRLFAEQKHQLIDQAIAEANGNLTEAANRLGVNRVTLHKILRNAQNDSPVKK